MRLAHIKLAGFKSFVDPTHIVLPGRLVGVVGPNGCGKSNVIDAVRWVLGESRAHALRGEVMQDVIFNGSGGRAPVSRASVELVFDNRLGQAAGPWTAYPEIAIKRVLLRDADSGYYINNQHVRRRDVADIFLGTGLGGRAYAIIEQGMITRVVEAKPEELRVYLEEAAGVSKYRERRRETEAKLSEARHNLSRVEDILRELAEQLARLEEQAKIAERYQELRHMVHTIQNLIWFIRKRDAQTARERLDREQARVQNELDAETTRLRAAEAEAESLRQRHYTLADALDARQNAFYQASAEVAGLEHELKHLRENRRRVDAQIEGLRTQFTQHQEARGQAEGELKRWREELEQAQRQLEAALAAQGAEQVLLPAVEQAWHARRAEQDQRQSLLAEARQRLNVEETHRDHATRQIEKLQAREARLMREHREVIIPEPSRVEELSLAHERAQTRLADLRDRLTHAEHESALRERLRAATRQQLDDTRAEWTALFARRDALQLLQSKLGSDDALDSWINRRGLDVLPRLWQSVRIESGWEDALEAVLRERLNGVAIGHGETDGELLVSESLESPPPGKLALFKVADGVAFESADDDFDGWRPLRNYVSLKDTAVAAALDDWLHGVYAAVDRHAAQSSSPRLPAGAALVCPEGHLFTRHGVSFYAPDSALHGVLSRQCEIEALDAQLAELDTRREREQASLDQAESAWAVSQSEISALRDACAQEQQQAHEFQVAALQAAQELDRSRERERQIERGLADYFSQVQHETVLKQTAENRVASLRADLDRLERELDCASLESETAEATFNFQREKLEGARRALASARFHAEACDGKINDIVARIQVLDEIRSEVGASLQKLLEEQSSLDEGPLCRRLQAQLEALRVEEQNLAAARDSAERAVTLLKTADETRFVAEQRLVPLREALSEVQLKEQEARLHEEQYAEQLRAAGAEEADLAGRLEKGTRVGTLQTELVRASDEIEALGAVNLAALDELKAARDREHYLASQAQDLTQAADTLQQAIVRMDREARERLRSTFDEVNRHFSELFPALFGGGEARLEMTGSDVLNTGVEIVARPPGKKNSSIHLLSGGEKALTALALIFSMFKLNPAPFCLLDEVDAPLDDRNTERYCELVRKMSEHTQFLFITHNKITMELAEQLIGVTMAEQGVSRIVAVDVEQAIKLKEEAIA